MIVLTDLAAEKLKESLSEDGQNGGIVRIAAGLSENGGVQYSLGLVEDISEGDAVVHSEGVQVIVDSDSMPLLDGSEIDYVDGLMRSGFVINNPNFAPTEGGGCGSGGGCACGGNCSCGGH